MRGITCCILLVLFEENRIIALDYNSNFTTNVNYEQMRLTNVVWKLPNIRKFQQKRQTICSKMRTKNLLELQVDNTTDFKQNAQQIFLFQDCNALYEAGYLQSDVYPIWIHQLYKFTYVFCDMDVQTLSNTTGWITIQRRINGEINFDRGWQNYVDGFGNVHGEYWIGLEHLHALSNQNTTTDWFGDFVTPPRMRIDFEDQDGITAYAEYRLFKVAGTYEKYRLIAAYLDQATAIPYNVPTPISRNWFSTFDNNSAFSGCPATFHGGWWFSACGESNLNGFYPVMGEKNSPSNIYWYYWYTVNENNTAFKAVSMKFQY
ncbi:angiopoietin-1-like [Ciona intestinalis]